MQTNEKNELLNYFRKIGEAAQNGTMEWSQANPTTLLYSPQGPTGGRIVLQKVERSERQRTRVGGMETKVIKQYLFQVQKSHGGGQALSINGADDAVINEQLEWLYEAISNSLSRRGLDYLKSLLP